MGIEIPLFNLSLTKFLICLIEIKTNKTQVGVDIADWNENKKNKKCLLPGIRSRISPKACEGYRDYIREKFKKYKELQELDCCKECVKEK